jgi:ketosteroid isomerase-like protein
MTPSPSSEEANIETVRKAIDAFNRRDTEAMAALGAKDFEYDWSRSMGPNRGVYKGVDGFLDFVNDQWGTFEDMRVEVHEFIPRGDDVIITITTHARGREGIPVSANSAQLYTFENGRLVRVTLYQDREEAMAATS